MFRGDLPISKNHNTRTNKKKTKKNRKKKKKETSRWMSEEEQSKKMMNIRGVVFSYYVRTYGGGESKCKRMRIGGGRVSRLCERSPINVFI